MIRVSGFPHCWVGKRKNCRNEGRDEIYLSRYGDWREIFRGVKIGGNLHFVFLLFSLFLVWLSSLC